MDRGWWAKWSSRARGGRRHRFAVLAAVVMVVSATAALGTPAPARVADAAAVVPDGFSDRVAIGGLTMPTDIAFAANGRVFVAEKSGIVKIFDSLSDPTPTVFADLRTQVHDWSDRGLLGITLDPQFPTRPYVYVLYTYNAVPGGTEPAWTGPGGDGCPDLPGLNTDGCVVQGRLSRLTADGDHMAGPELVLVSGWCQQFPGHSIGTVAFGSDGALYAGAGDGASYNYVDYGQTGNPCGDPPAPAGTGLVPPTAEGGALRSQSVRRPAGQPVTLDGTIIRVDPATGAGLPDNPFASSTDQNARRIVAYGMRNPFRFVPRPGTDQLWVGDVGWGEWEEIDRVADVNDGVAENFGWPCYEGAGRQSGYDAANLDRCESLYATAGAHTPPILAYRHIQPVVATDGCGLDAGSSISGMVFEDGSNYPAEYDRALFFADAARGCMWAMTRGSGTDPSPSRIQPFVGAAGAIVKVLSGPGGDIFYVDLYAGEIHRITYNGANHPPTAVINASTTSGPAPLTVAFDGRESVDLDATDQLSYAWDLDGDGQFDDSADPTPSFTYPSNGSVTVGLQVTDPAGAPDTATTLITIGSPNSPPVPVIDTPTAALRWKVGDPIVFSGHATDAQDGTLPGSRLTWSVLLNHCPGGCHVHPFQTFAGLASGSFPAPDHEYPASLTLVMTAVDTAGATASTSIQLNPQTVDLNFVTVPSGLQLSVGSSTVTAPATRTVIVGSANSVSAPGPQTLGGAAYAFDRWTDGGAASHNLVAPATPATYTATFATTFFAETLGGTTLDRPASTSWGPGRMDVAIQGSDSAVWHASADGVGANATTASWSSWESLGGTAIAGPATAAWAPGRLDVFVPGSDGALWHKWFDEGWSGWESLGVLTTMAPAVASWSARRLDVFVVGVDGALWHRAFDGSGWWPWENLGGQLSGAPSVASWAPGRLDVTAPGSDGAVYHLAFVSGAGWFDWESLGGLTMSGTGTGTAAPAFGRLEVTVTSTDNRVWHRSWVGFWGFWTPWAPLGGSAQSGPATSARSGRTDVFVEGTDGAVWHGVIPL